MRTGRVRTRAEFAALRERGSRSRQRSLRVTARARRRRRRPGRLRHRPAGRHRRASATGSGAGSGPRSPSSPPAPGCYLLSVDAARRPTVLFADLRADLAAALARGRRPVNAADARSSHAGVRGYRRVFAGRPSPCRYQPTCSAYALDALEQPRRRPGLVAHHPPPLPLPPVGWPWLGSRPPAQEGPPPCLIRSSTSSPPCCRGSTTLVPNYGIAIILLTIAVMLLVTPLTLKGTRSMLELQFHQPELRPHPDAVPRRPAEDERRD